MRGKLLPFHMPDIGETEIRLVAQTLRSGWLTTGPMVNQFEQEFAKYIGSPHAVAVNSGTAALHLALEAIGLKEGDEAIIPTMTFAATAEVALYFKATPVLVDCQPDTLNVDPSLIEKAITPKTKAIIPLHFGGQPCEMNRVLEIARAFDLRVVDDAAHAFPARHQDTLIGTSADLTCFSFYATKTITTGEGGMVTTDNSEWAERIRMMSLHGISKDAWKRYTAEGSWYYEIMAPGYKYNLTDIAAAIGLAQLKRCQRFWEARRVIAAKYHEGLADLPEIRRPVFNPAVQHAWHLYVIQMELDRLRIDRNQFIEALIKHNIATSVHFIPLHLHPYYRKTFGYSPGNFPTASSVFQRIVSLPIYPKMTDADVERVIETVRKVIQQYRR